MNNPFNITKAVDYSDEQLNELWVDFPKRGFSSTIKPRSEMPMMILGSKGSGKTHIMKHFSYTMQSIRHKNELLKGIKEDGYIGTYLRCSGLNAYKFNGRGESPKIWESYFSYYLELWLGQLILNNINKLTKSIKLSIDESKIVNQIINLFDKKIDSNSITSIEELSMFLSLLQKKIDYTINNRAFTRNKISESIEILLSPGSLIFGIPSILSTFIPDFKNIKFLYLLDEYENFTELQQKYFNTLIRERKNPTCFKIGARRYGIRTTLTLSADEEIKQGSEYEILDIDSTFRDNPQDYKEFIKQICYKRLDHSNLVIDKRLFDEYFNSFDENRFYNQVKYRKSRHLRKLHNKLKRYSNDNDLIKKIVSNIRFKKNVLFERANIMMIYRAWKRNKDLLLESQNIKKSCIDYYKDSNINNEHKRILSKYKSDLLNALARENSIRIETYSGLNNLIKISNGIPRHFLTIMKHLYRWSAFDEKSMFKSLDEKASIYNQLDALNDTVNWFIEDAKIPGENGNKIKDCIERLCDYLRDLRFSDLPPECAISSFYINSKHLPKEINTIIDFLEQYSYIIRITTGRRDKNLHTRNQTYQINGLLAAEWELSLTRRGIIGFDSYELNNIFIPESNEKYKSMKSENLIKYNSPFPATKTNIPTLFNLD